MNIPVFSEDELTKVGTYGRITRWNTPISPRENLYRALRRENPLWLPSKLDMRIICPSVYPDNVARAFVIEGKPYEGEVGGLDSFGIKWKFIPTVGGSMVEPGNPYLEDIADWKEKIYFPNINDWDWEKSAEENKEYLDTDLFTTSWIFSGMFERLISFMDFENAAVALVDDDQKDDVKELFQALVEFYKELIDKLIECYHVDSIFFHDDWGSQRSPFFSLETCREMLVPYMKQIVDYCHSKNVIFDFHCCGKSQDLVPAMIEAGMDMWGGQPLNDKKMLVDTYGDKIMIGVNDPFALAPDTTYDDLDKLQKDVDAFIDKYLCGMPVNTAFLMNYHPNDDVYAALYRSSRKYLAAIYEKQ